MTEAEKKEEARARIVVKLKRKVRKHRPAAKVLEIEIAMMEDMLEQVEKQKAGKEWELEYLRTLKASDLEEE